MPSFVEKIFRNSFKEPGNIFRLSIVFVLICSFIFTIFGINISREAGENLPLLIFGMSLIMCILIFVEGKTAALLLSITLVGTVVAREEFIIKITHMIRSNPQQLGTYLEDYKQPAEIQAVASISDIVEKEIKKSLGGQIKESEKEQIIRIVTKAQLSNIHDRIKREGNIRLLGWFENDRDRWLREISTLWDNKFFLRDARVLVREGVIDCTLSEASATRTELAECRLTALGQEIAVFAKEQKATSRTLKEPPLKEPTLRLLLKTLLLF